MTPLIRNLERWNDWLSVPRFILTSDQDWAPAWAAQNLITKARNFDIPLHVFRTNPCPHFDGSFNRGEITQGWHPNFLKNSSQGGDPEQVIQYCQEHFPGANTVRTHTFYEDTHCWLLLSRAGIVADSQLVTTYQPEIKPLQHWTGIVRWPVYFEDDVFFNHFPNQLDLDVIVPTLFTPGLKVFNFHATFLAYNVPSQSYYDQRKAKMFSSQERVEDIVFSGRGTSVVFDELMAIIHDKGHKFESFQSLADQLKA